MKTILIAPLFLFAGIVSISRAGRTFVNPMGHKTLRVIKECQDTDGEYTLIEVTAQPNTKGPPLHHHSVFEERVKILVGTMHATINGKHLKASAGEKNDFKANSVHRWWTENEPVKFQFETHPCHDGFHQGVEILANLEPEKRTKDGFPKSAWYLAVGQEIMGTALDIPHVSFVLNPVFKWMAQTDKGRSTKEEMLGHLPQNVKEEL